eukprot:969686-Pelagomonas_calceolata.AAC.7
MVAEATCSNLQARPLLQCFDKLLLLRLVQARAANPLQCTYFCLAPVSTPCPNLSCYFFAKHLFLPGFCCSALPEPEQLSHFWTILQFSQTSAFACAPARASPSLYLYSCLRACAPPNLSQSYACAPASVPVLRPNLNQSYACAPAFARAPPTPCEVQASVPVLLSLCLCSPKT